ncbi:UDP-N-acetylmuramoyl-L-alanyl-D-glutamate--2,6-diaminopimelate ligase [subsurface metagenome]
MKLSDIKNILPQAEFLNFQDIEITDISYDSRQTREGHLFVAVPGSKSNGHHFIADAISHGCRAVVTRKKINLAANIPQIMVSDPRRALALLSSNFYNHPSTRLKVIGITGTNGKTTVTYLIKSILEAQGERTGLLGTIQYQVGDRQIPAPMTTPESYDLQKFLSEMLQVGVNYVVMEVSSHALTQQRVSQTNFTSAVFTNLTRDHLDFHKDIKSYREAKSLLFKSLRPDASAVLNKDDETSAHLARLTKAKVIWYGLDSEAEVKAQVLQSSLTGMKLALTTPKGEFEINTPLIGRHNVYNILAAVAETLSLGIEPDIIIKGIEAVKTIRGRLEPVYPVRSKTPRASAPPLAGTSNGVECHRDFYVMVDYAHTDNALENVLKNLKPIVPGRIILVFGCGGDRDKGKRPLMGKVAEEYADIFVITSDNPRSEEPLEIINDIKKGLSQPSNAHTYPDRYEAIKYAISQARKDDLVLVAGKGHETYQTFKDTVKPFDDRAVVKEILGESPADRNEAITSV